MQTLAAFAAAGLVLIVPTSLGLLQGLSAAESGEPGASAPLAVQADALEVTIHPITSSPDAIETTPRLGADSFGPIVTYPSSAMTANGPAPANIHYQRVGSTGVPVGTAIVISLDTDDSLHDVLNDISGSRIVYIAMAATSTVGMARLYDIPSASTFDLLSEPGAVGAPRIEGDVVVWLEGKTGETTVQLADLRWPVFAPITIGGGVGQAATQAEIGSRYVVWTRDSADHSDIVARDLWTDAMIVVAGDSAVDERDADTYGDWVVWVEHRSGASSIWARNVTTFGPPILIAENGAAVANPSISDGAVAYESNVSGNFDIYLYRFSDATTYQITQDAAEQRLPDLFGDLVAYVDHDPGSADIAIAHVNFSGPCDGAGGDPDMDGVCEVVDTCPGAANPNQADWDGDGAGDACDPDDDNDALLDTTELIDTGTDPFNPDTDTDGIRDGAEVVTGTNPNSPDTDGDGLPDGEDPTPNTPGAPGSYVEQRARELAEQGLALNLSLFNAPNPNSRMGRRNSLANRLTSAANYITAGDVDAAIDELFSLLARIDGLTAPPDWMEDSPEKDALAAEVRLLLTLLGASP